MAGAARSGDNVRGTHTGEEGDTLTFTGTISSGSSKVFVNGQAAAYAGSATSESDSECSGTGSVSSGSSKVFVEGKAAARNGDSVTGHKGSGTITSGSSNVIFN